MSAEPVAVAAVPIGRGPLADRIRFAAALREFRSEAGSPSYARLYRLSPLLHPTAISEVLNARSAPRLEFVLAFVEAVREHADRAGISLSPDECDPETWRRRWTTFRAEPASHDPQALAWLTEAQRLVVSAADRSHDAGLVRAALLLRATLESLETPQGR